MRDRAPRSGSVARRCLGAPACPFTVEAGHAACRGCWRALPEELRARVCRAWRAVLRARRNAVVVEVRDALAGYRDACEAARVALVAQRAAV